MDNLTGYPLKDALKFFEDNNYRVINIKKVIGTNKKFNNLYKPYVIRQHASQSSVTLYISYY